MFRQVLIATSLIFVTGCTSLNSTLDHADDAKIASIKIENREQVERPKLDLKKPEKPVLTNNMRLFMMKTKDVEMVCTSDQDFRGHLADLLEIYKYQQELESSLDAYINYYETNVSK